MSLPLEKTMHSHLALANVSHLIHIFQYEMHLIMKRNSRKYDRSPWSWYPILVIVKFLILFFLLKYVKNKLFCFVDMKYPTPNRLKCTD